MDGAFAETLGGVVLGKSVNLQVIDAVSRAPPTRSGSAVPPVSVNDPNVVIATFESVRSAFQAVKS